MLFNSYEFIYLYLPIVFFGFFGFFWVAKYNHRLASLWLAVASVFFYGWWNLQFVFLLLASIVFNYGMGYTIGHARTALRLSKKSTWMLVDAVATNLLLLGYFKYVNFFINTANQIVGSHWVNVDIVLPLGISFFTFTQIAFLVDVHRGIATEYRFVHYLLFVTYFPHLIVGLISHHKQLMPQLRQADNYQINTDNVNIGLTIFIIGLFKKLVLADHFAIYAPPVFDAVDSGGDPKLIEAWVGTLAYTLQLYFDFSGYSDVSV
jgi:alginate O-acetyltransferase complex protein AlgI